MYTSKQNIQYNTNLQFIRNCLVDGEKNNNFCGGQQLVVVSQVKHIKARGSERNNQYHPSNSLLFVKIKKHKDRVCDDVNSFLSMPPF